MEGDGPCPAPCLAHGVSLEPEGLKAHGSCLDTATGSYRMGVWAQYCSVGLGTWWSPAGSTVSSCFRPGPSCFCSCRMKVLSRMEFAQADTDPSVSVMGCHPLLRPCCVSATTGQHGGCSLLCAITSLHGGPTCQGHPLCAALWHIHCGSDSGAALYLFQAQCCGSTGGQQGALREQDGADWTTGRVLTLKSTWIRSWHSMDNCSLDSAPAH